MAQKKTLEFNIKFKLKNMPIEEYEAIMKPYRKNMLLFERTLRKLADSGVISYKILDTITSKFNFAALQRERFTIPDEPEFSQPQIQQQPINQPTSGFNFTQPHQPQQPQTQPGVGFGQQQQSPAPNQATKPVSASNFATSRQPAPPVSTFEQPPSQPSFNPPQQSPTETGFNSPSSNPPPSFGSFSDNAFSSSPSPSTPKTTPNFGLSGDLGNKPASTPPAEGKVSIGIDEEDRATGIAILRKKMLMELRKIRNVVEQEDSDNF